MTEYKYLSSQQIVEDVRYPFTMGQLRYYLLKRHKNGLDKAIRHIGKRLYFRQDLFDQWIEEQTSKGGEL